MVRLSNNVIGIMNVVTVVMSIPILLAGVWLSHEASSECERFLEKPMVALGVFLMVVSIAGIVGAWCRATWLLWVYLLVMFVLIVLLFCFTIFAFVVTNKDAGEALSGKGYKEYHLGDYSNWLQKRFAANRNWSKIRSCLADSKVCQDFSTKYVNFLHLSPLQSGCCKPSNDCNFTYVKPTNGSKTGGDYTNPDCNKWDNNSAALCFDCESCKAGVLESIKGDWKRVAVANVIILISLIMVYSIGCCAFRNNRQDNSWKRQINPYRV